MSLDANRRDLERHARDFAERTGFTFTVLRPGAEEVIGCLYIYPAENGGGDAQVRSWGSRRRSRAGRPAVRRSVALAP